MAASGVGSLICIIAIFSHLTYSRAPNIQNLLDAIEKLIKYYENNYKSMNLDGMFGLRVLEGQVQLLLNEHNTGQHQQTPVHVITRMQIIYAKAHDISNKALPYLAIDDPEYLASMSALVKNPWKFKHAHRILNDTLRWPTSITKGDAIDENLSDKCMKELLGTSNKSGIKCNLSQQCINIMGMTKGFTEYAITHQLLFTMLAKECGCHNKLDRHQKRYGNKRGIAHFQLELCSNNYYEMLFMAGIHNGTIISQDQDLFLEIQFVCPNLGFVQFLSLYWLKQILTWQSPTGCFVEADRHVAQNTLLNNRRASINPNTGLNEIKTLDLNADNSKLENYARKGQAVVHNALQSNRTTKTVGVHADAQRSLLSIETWNSRRLLVEKDLPDGCLSHKTGVAAGALVMYLRYMVDPGPQQFLPYELNKENYVYLPKDISGVSGVFTEAKKVRAEVDHRLMLNKLRQGGAMGNAKDRDIPSAPVQKEGDFGLNTNNVDENLINNGEGNDVDIEGDVDGDNGENKDETEDAKKRANEEYDKYDVGKDEDRDEDEKEPGDDRITVKSYEDIDADYMKSHLKGDSDIYPANDMNQVKVDKRRVVRKDVYLINNPSESRGLHWTSIFIFCISLCVLYFMYRFIRKRKFVIRYHRRN